MTFLFPLIGLVFGIFLGNATSGSPGWGILPVIASVATYLLLLKKTALPLKALRLNSRHSIWILMLFIGIGMLDSWYHRPMLVNDREKRCNIAADGVIEEAYPYAQGDQLVVNVHHMSDDKGEITECRNFRLLLITDGFSSDIGDQILFPLRLEEITDNANFRSKGYAERMRRKGLCYRSRALGDEILIKSHVNTLRGQAVRYRDQIEIFLEKSSLERETAKFVISILLGDKSFLTSDTKAIFSNAGVAHMLALSGLHVAIIMGIILFVLFPLQLAGLHNMRRLIALVLLWGYVFFTGMALPTIRAALMTSFVIIALLLQRKKSSGNSLMAAAFIIILLDPFAIYDVGMQLSCLCVACILAFAGPLNTINARQHPRMHALTSAILVSMIASLGSWVLVSYYFKQVPLLFLPANLLLLPLLPVFILCSILYIVLLLFGIDLSLLAYAIDVCYDIFVKISLFLSSFGHSTIDYQATLPVIVLWLAGVMALGYSLRRRKKLVSYIVGFSMIAGSLILIPALASVQPDGVIFQQNLHDISVALYDSDKENIRKFPRNTVSRIIHKGCEILSVDCPQGIDSIGKYVNRRDVRKRELTDSSKRYLILGSGMGNKKLKDISGLENFDKIFLHSSIRKKRESILLQEAFDLGLRQVYSLREKGPYEESW